MKKNFVYWLALALFVMMGCRKEVSFEVGNKPSGGSLQSETTGDCLPKAVNGNYVAATPLVPATNTIIVSVNVNATGNYTIATDTVNGYFFRATGIFTAVGTTSVTLRGNGTPFAAGVNNFVVIYDSTVCDIAVTVLPVGSTPAVLTLEGAPGNCSGALVNGSYATGNPLNFTNTVKLNVNVTTIGTYNISTTKNGMTFSKSGSFTATGVQLVTLVGTGTPTVNGDNVVPITAGTTTCSFTVPVGIPAVGTLGGAPGSCTPATVNGTYTVGTILTTANSVIIQVNIGTPGAYSITTNTVAGIKFAASGSFSTSGTQALTLNGTGTPAASGNQVFTVTFGTSSCTFTVPISGGAGAAVFIADCFSAVETGVYAAGTALNSTNTVDIDINVATPGTYNIATTATNGMVFSANGTFATAGTTTITLVGSGTPLTAGTFNIPMPGTTSCTFPVTVNGAATINWKFTEGPSTLQGGFDLGSLQVISVPPLTLTSYTFSGSNATLDFTLILADIGGGIMNGETYSTTSTTVNNVALLVNDMSGTVYEANASIAGLTFKATVTSHNTSTKTITGTFSGTVKNGAGVTKTITGGTFTGTYP